MAEVVSQTRYSGGRGRGILGLYKASQVGSKVLSDVKTKQKVETKSGKGGWRMSDLFTTCWF